MGSKWFILDVCLIVVVIFAFIFLVIGYATPDWIYVTQDVTNADDYGFHRSIWYNRLCPDGNCVTSSHGNLGTEISGLGNTGFAAFTASILLLMKPDEEWDAWQACSTISVVFAFFGLVLAFYLVWYVNYRRYKYWRVYALIGFIIMVIASVLMWVPVIMIADINNDLDDLNLTLITVKPPSALIIAAIGAFLALVGAFIFLLYMCRYGPPRRHHKRPRTPESSIDSYVQDSKYVYGRPPVQYVERPQVEYVERPPVQYVERSHKRYSERPAYHEKVQYLERPSYDYESSPNVRYISSSRYQPRITSDDYRSSRYLAPITGGEYYPSRISSRHDLNDRNYETYDFPRKSYRKSDRW